MEDTKENIELQKIKMDLEFQKLKFKVETIKWLLGTLIFGIIVFFVDSHFKDREHSLSETLQFDKYATDLIILNNDPVKKRMLAQFFSNVTPSTKLRNGWKKYYYEVNNEYIEFKNNELLIKTLKFYFNSIDTTKNPLNKIQKLILAEIEKEDLKNQIINNNSEIITSKEDKNDKSSFKIHFFNSTLADSIYNIKEFNDLFHPETIKLTENLKVKKTELRYFNKIDKELAVYVKNIITRRTPVKEIDIVYVSYYKNIKKGNLELWLN